MPYPGPFRMSGAAALCHQNRTMHREQAETGANGLSPPRPLFS